MEHFDFGSNSIAAVVLDIGRTQVSTGVWLVDKIKNYLMDRAHNLNKPCLIFMSQSHKEIPKTASESTYQIDTFKQSSNEYSVFDDLKNAISILGESHEDAEKHLVLITKNYKEIYLDAFNWMKNKEYDIKLKIIGVGKEVDFLQLVAEDFSGSFVKAVSLPDLNKSIEEIGV